jgi:hypothetical protein
VLTYVQWSQQQEQQGELGSAELLEKYNEYCQEFKLKKLQKFFDAQKNAAW